MQIRVPIVTDWSAGDFIVAAEDFQQISFVPPVDLYDFRRPPAVQTQEFNDLRPFWIGKPHALTKATEKGGLS